MKPLYNIGDLVYFVHDDTLTVSKYYIQGIQKVDSNYHDYPVYLYSLEDVVYKTIRNLDNNFIKVHDNEIFVSRNEANKRLNCIRKEKRNKLVSELNRIGGK